MIKFIQLPVCKLSGFLGSAVTSFNVAGFLLNDGVTPVDPADIGDICYATLEPKTVREELISFTIDSVTAEGVATVTAIRGLSQISPYGAGGAAFDHQSGSDLVISNNPGLLNKFGVKSNDEVVTGSWSFPAPVAGGNAITKTYFEGTVDPTLVHTTGDESIDGIKTFVGPVVVPDAVAMDEAVNLGQVEDLDDANVKLTGNQTVAGIKTFSASPVVPDATAANQPYTKGQHDADAEASSAIASDSVRGTSKLDTVADNPLDPKTLTATAVRIFAMLGINNIPSLTNPFVTKDDLSDPTVLQPQVVAFTASGTWTKDAGLKYIVVEVQGGGAQAPSSSGGGGGGYAKKLIPASALGATETVTVGAVGALSSFGAHAIGGAAAGSAPGSGTGGDINITGGRGNPPTSADNSRQDGGSGGGSMFGFGGTNVSPFSLGVAATGYGGGGGGWGSEAAGAVGDGTPGIVIVTEHYS